MLLLPVSLNLTQSQNQTARQNIHYQTVSLLLAIIASSHIVRREIAQILTHHATPITASKETPVFSLIVFPRFGRGATS